MAEGTLQDWLLKGRLYQGQAKVAQDVDEITNQFHDVGCKMYLLAFSVCRWWYINITETSV